MSHRSSLLGAVSAVAIALTSFSPLDAAAAANRSIRVAAKSFAVLHAFGGAPDGASPEAGVTVDKAGRLFGTTNGGGSSGCGTVFELAPSSGTFTESIAHDFARSDGCAPYAPPIEDAAGDLFATTQSGGDSNNQGTLVELTPSSGGYSESKVVDFDGTDGNNPYDGLLGLGSTIYAVPSFGGKKQYGAIVAFTAVGLKPTVLYNFDGPPNDGEAPLAALVADASGALYGTTELGGSANMGAVFKFVPSGKGGTETLLWSFQGGNDGAMPVGRLVLDAAGNIYGATSSGGSDGFGTVFELSPQGATYTEKLLHTFDVKEGSFPSGGLVIKGKFLYGVTSEGGSALDGVLYKIETSGAHFSVLHTFTGPDGTRPVGELALKGATFFGATESGGTGTSCSGGCGVIYAFVP